jgi:hypothetical protein
MLYAYTKIFFPSLSLLAAQHYLSVSNSESRKLKIIQEILLNCIASKQYFCVTVI